MYTVNTLIQLKKNTFSFLFPETFTQKECKNATKKITTKLHCLEQQIKTCSDNFTWTLFVMFLTFRRSVVSLTSALSMTVQTSLSLYRSASGGSSENWTWGGKWYRSGGSSLVKTSPASERDCLCWSSPSYFHTFVKDKLSLRVTCFSIDLNFPKARCVLCEPEEDVHDVLLAVPLPE